MALTAHWFTLRGADVMGTIIAALATIAAAVIGAYMAHELKRRDRLYRSVNNVPHRRIEIATPFAFIKGVSFSTDYDRDGKRGMSIFVDIALCNVAGVDCAVVAYFSYATGQPVQDLNGAYRTYENQVSTHVTLRPSTSEEIFRNVELWIPYEEIHVGSGLHDLSFYLAAVRESTEDLLASTGDYVWTFSQM
jgi:hypothetical protein